jgi:L-fucose mutarotase/ribose pyranase (RbsD/FucU family)
MPILSPELVDYLKSRGKGKKFFLGETENKKCEKRNDKYAAPPEVRKENFARPHAAAQDRRDPLAFYDRSSAARSFVFARETRKFANPTGTILR